jgi:hypothetical protein
MRKTATKKPATLVQGTMRPALPNVGPNIQEIEQAHAVLTGLEVENRVLRSEHRLLLKFAQLTAVHANELALALKALSGDVDLAKKFIASMTNIHTLTKQEHAWIEENVTTPAQALAEACHRIPSETVAEGDEPKEASRS